MPTLTVQAEQRGSGVQPPSSAIRAAAIDSPRRTGPLLRAATLSAACIELIDHVFLTAGRDREIAATYAESRRLLPSPDCLNVETWWVVEQLAAYGSTVRLRPEVWPALTQSVQSRIETARRRRAARMFGLPPLKFSTFTVPWSVPGLTRDTRTALRILAAAGPMYIDDVLEAVGQTWAPKVQHVPEYERMVASLVSSGARTVRGDDRWTFSGPIDPCDAAIIAAARRTERKRQTIGQLEEVLASAGVSGGGSSIYTARLPLIVRRRWNTYEILGALRATSTTCCSDLRSRDPSDYALPELWWQQLAPRWGWRSRSRDPRPFGGTRLSRFYGSMLTARTASNHSLLPPVRDSPRAPRRYVH